MSEEKTEGMGKRSLILVVAIAGAVLILGAAASLAAGWWRVGSLPVNAAGPAVRAYFGDLKDGSKLDRWTLVRVYDVRLGGIPVVMATQDGTRYQVDLLKRDPAGPKGIADTTELSLFVVNGGEGKVPTPEEQGLGVLQLAAALTTRENGGAKPPALSTMTERTTKSPDRHFAIPTD